MLYIGVRNCYIPWDIFDTYNLVRLIVHYVIGMMMPYGLVAVFNALIVFQMMKYRRVRAGMSASGDSKSDDSAQRYDCIRCLVLLTHNQ